MANRIPEDRENDLTIGDVLILIGLVTLAGSAIMYTAFCLVYTTIKLIF